MHDLSACVLWLPWVPSLSNSEGWGDYVVEYVSLWSLSLAIPSFVMEKMDSFCEHVMPLEYMY